MEEKNYWKVERGGIYAVITCPVCKAWFDVPNAPGNVESYHHCPHCAHPMMVRDEDKYMMKRTCHPKCEHLALRKEDYDDDILGYCHAYESINEKLIGPIDEIHTGQCECILQERRKSNGH